MTDPVKLQRKARGERPKYFEDPAIDKVLSITLALAGEVAVLRDHIDSMERLLETDGTIDREALHAFSPDRQTREERDAWRDEFLSTILRCVHEEREALAEEASSGSAKGISTYDDAVDLVETA